MKKKLALIFGHTGGIGSATRTLFANKNILLCPVDRALIDFELDNSDKKISEMLNNVKPDIVINCAGNFINGYQDTHTKIMNVNFGSNWSLVKYYATHQEKKVRIIMIGSSSYSGGRKLYPLYSASKAALYNLWESCKEQFEGSNVTIDLINPVRTLTPMSSKNKKIDPTLEYLQPEQVAEQIYKLAEEDMPARCINMTFKETK